MWLEPCTSDWGDGQARPTIFSNEGWCGSGQYFLQAWVCLCAFPISAWLWLALSRICRCLRQDRPKHLVQLAWKFLARGRAGALTALPEQEKERHVQGLVLQWRLEQARQLFRVVAAVSPLFLAWEAYRLWSQGLWGNVSFRYTYISLFEQLWIEHVFVACAASLFTVFPGTVSLRLVHTVHGLVMAMFAAHMFVRRAEVFVTNQVYYIALVRTTFAMVFGNQRLVASLNASFVTCELLVFTVAGTEGRMRAIFGLAAVCTASMVAESFVAAAARATIDARIAAKSEALAHNLLSGMCDAVVHLGPDLRISEASASFDGLLIREGQLCKGRAFLDQVHPQDRERCQEFLQQVPPETDEHGTSVQSARVQLTWHGGSVRVTLHHRAVCDLDGNLIHVIGMQEEMEDQRPHAEVMPAQQRLQDGSRPSIGLGAVCEHLSMGEAKGAASAAVDPMAPECNAGPREAIVTCNLRDEGLPMVHCNDAAVQLLGPEAIGSRLVDAMAHGEDCQDWARAVLSLHLEGVVDKRDALNRFHATLWPQGDRPASPVRCSLIFPQGDEARQSTDAAVLAQLSLQPQAPRSGAAAVCGSGAPEDVRLACDSADQGLPIRRCNDAAALLFGSEPVGLRLADAVEDGQALHEWVQHRMNQHLWDPVEERDARHRLSLRLRPRGACAALPMLCQMAFPEASEEEQDEDESAEVLAHLVLQPRVCTDQPRAREARGGPRPRGHRSGCRSSHTMGSSSSDRGSSNSGASVRSVGTARSTVSRHRGSLGHAGAAVEPAVFGRCSL